MPPKQPVPPEAPQKRQFTRFNMRLEGYFNVDTDEFLDEFERQLREHGLHPEDLVFSGFKSEDVKRGRRPRHVMIFGMDEAGWREANRRHEPNPAKYAEGCIGLYDRHQLREAYSGDIKFEQDITTEHMLDDSDTRLDILKGAVVMDGPVSDDRIELDAIEPGDALSEMGPDRVVKENVVHIDYPHRRATDALIGLVYIDL